MLNPYGFILILARQLILMMSLLVTKLSNDGSNSTESKENGLDNNNTKNDDDKKESFDLESQQYGLDVHHFAKELRRASHYGSSDCAKDTCFLLRSVIQKGRFKTWGQLLEAIQCIGEKLIRARPLELVIGNIVKRLLFIIRREHRYWSKLKKKREKWQMKQEEKKQKHNKNNKYQTLNKKKKKQREQMIFNYQQMIYEMRMKH